MTRESTLIEIEEALGRVQMKIADWEDGDRTVCGFDVRDFRMIVDHYVKMGDTIKNMANNILRL